MLHYEMYINSLNEECKSLITFIHFVYWNKKKEHQIKTVVKIYYKSIIYLLGGEKANRFNFMQSMLILYSSCYFF